ncbi:MAG: DUF3945 domain-containing protein [Bacteroidales bacterium]|nr:DUF3945 domain-containing protein [Bacteroidales bacterium]
MEEDLKDQDVLLVRNKKSNELKAVTGINEEEGTLKTTLPKETNNPDFMRIDKQGNVLENFFENFTRQVKNPTHFEFFRVPAENMDEAVKKLQNAFTPPETPGKVATQDMHRVEPKTFLKKQEQTQTQGQTQSQTPLSNNAIDESRVDWKQFERLGITRESLEKTGNLDKLLNWQKTDLLPISLKFDDVSLRTDARLGLRETPDGKLTVAIHAIRKEPELDKYYFGIKFTDEDKQNFLKTGNLGRVAEAEYRQGEKTPVLISIDKQTNELVAVRADKVKIPETVKGVQLNEVQKKDLAEGKAVWIENMTSKKNTPFSAYLQFNADKKGFEFRFDNEKQAQNQTQKQGNEQQYVPKTFRKQELNEDQRSSLKEGKTVYVSGLEDKKGKQYSGYITLDKENGKLDFMFPKAYKEAVAAGKVIPDDRHKTQVAVNSEGKTSEATKNVKEPLTKGQTQPTEKQAEKQEKKEVKAKQETDKPKKSKGRKI